MAYVGRRKVHVNYRLIRLEDTVVVVVVVVVVVIAAAAVITISLPMVVSIIRPC